MKRYNLINNILGWVCFAIAAVTYLLTVEPTASFWDCPEFILQGFKLEVGHPPGNPVFMLAARFFINFVGGDVTKVALAVNCMSALLSAATILLLFWTITHLVRRLIIPDNDKEVSLTKIIVTMGAGLCGALAYTWSDTFWFSAVEGEVYAFSSFCTALVFWLILKWENRADQPHSDKYLVLIAYVIGISIAVHLLNLLCIPAIVLVIYYKKWANPTGKGSLIALVISFVIVAAILYGLVPGFIEMAQYAELLFVNGLGMSYNVGTLIYAILLLASFVWAVYELYALRSPNKVRISFVVMVLMSGILLIGSSWWLPLLLLIALCAYLWGAKKLNVRVLTICAMSIFVIFIGYSSYALLLIRSSSATPMNQNAPDNVFALSSYLNREQYGETPLIYGRTINSQPLYIQDYSGRTPIYDEGPALYAKTVKTSPEQPDEYVMTGHKKSYKMTPELNMLFPRIHSSADRHPEFYREWIGFQGEPVLATTTVDASGNPIDQRYLNKPTMAENLRFFLVYQLNHMYWRYFMWNFAGRQNDIQGNGEVNQGNWISGIPFIDNPRLGDQSLLPYDEGEGNKGHNVFYMLPLLLGLIGLGWQAFTSKRGIEQFWVVFFLFFMTGIAIVLYLNQTPGQPRERDYAFAGSFYAFTIWIGMGVPALWRLLCNAFKKEKPSGNDSPSDKPAMAIVAAVIGLVVPLQMVSQTWDDHDRSGRYTTRDFGFNYLNSLDENAIIFTNGDNDTFPLWYAQEVEGERTDVKVVNLSYLTTDWYVNQIIRPTYNSPGIKIQGKPEAYAYDKMQYNYFIQPDTTPVNALNSLRDLYSPESYHPTYGVNVMNYPVVYIPVDTAAMIRAGRISADEAQAAEPYIITDLSNGGSASGATLSEVVSLDMLATSAQNGWNRPVYFAMTVPESYYLGLSPYVRNTGLAYEVGPVMSRDGRTSVNTDKMYANITEKFRWGGLDKIGENGKVPYLDETVRRMVTTHRSAILDLATALYNEGVQATELGDSVKNPDYYRESLTYADDRFAKATAILDLMLEKLPVKAMPLGWSIGPTTAELYCRLGMATGNKELTEKGLKLYKDQIDQFTDNVRYYQSLTPVQYATLSRTDKYIYQILFVDTIQSYIDYGGDLQSLEDEIVARGVNLQRVLELYQRAMSSQGGAEMQSSGEE